MLQSSLLMVKASLFKSNRASNKAVIAPTLFIIFLAAITHMIKNDLPSGLNIVYRTDGQVFNLSRLRSKNRTSVTSPMEFQYADDNCVVSTSEDHLQQILNAFNSAYIRLGLSINQQKTQILYQPKPGDSAAAAVPSLTIGNKAPENVDCFPYHESHLLSKADIQDEVQYRLKCAGAAHHRLRTCVFQNRNIQTDTKLAVYKAVVLPKLLYASETRTTYRCHLKALEKFHQRSLRRILSISSEDYFTNISVLQEAKTNSVEATVIKNQLRWIGHVVRMPDSRLRKQLFYCQLKEGKRSRGGQKKRYKDLLKANLKKCKIKVSTWETQAKDRPTWRQTVAEGTSTFEANRCADFEGKRKKRKGRELRPRAKLPTGTTCSHCGRKLMARIGLISHIRTHRTEHDHHPQH